MQLSLFATLLSLAFSSKDVGHGAEQLLKSDVAGTTRSTAIVDSIPAAAKSDKFSNDEAISGIKIALSSQIGNQVDKEKVTSSYLLEVTEDIGTAVQENQSNSPRLSEDETTVMEQSPRIPKTRLDRTKTTAESEQVISKYQRHSLNKLESVDGEIIDNSTLLWVIEDNGFDIQENQSSSSQCEDDTADIETSQRIPKSRLKSKNTVSESEDGFDENRLEIIKRMDRFIQESETHPLNKIMCTATKALCRFDEARKTVVERLISLDAKCEVFISRGVNLFESYENTPLNKLVFKTMKQMRIDRGSIKEDFDAVNEKWNDNLMKSQDFVMECFSKSVDELASLKHYISRELDTQSPIIYYGKTGVHLRVLSDVRFDSAVKACKELITRKNLGNYRDPTAEKGDLLIFAEVLLDLIDPEKLYDAVEIAPLCEALEKVENDYCGYPNSMKHGKPLNDSCLRLIGNIKNDLENIKPLLTHGNRNNRVFLIIKRLPEPKAIPNVPQARPTSRETQLISIDFQSLYVFQVSVLVTVVLLVLSSVFAHY